MKTLKCEVDDEKMATELGKWVTSRTKVESATQKKKYTWFEDTFCKKRLKYDGRKRYETRSQNSPTRLEVMLLDIMEITVLNAALQLKKHFAEEEKRIFGQADDLAMRIKNDYLKRERLFHQIDLGEGEMDDDEAKNELKSIQDRVNDNHNKLCDLIYVEGGSIEEDIEKYMDDEKLTEEFKKEIKNVIDESIGKTPSAGSLKTDMEETKLPMSHRYKRWKLVNRYLEDMSHPRLANHPCPYVYPIWGSQTSDVLLRLFTEGQFTGQDRKTSNGQNFAIDFVTHMKNKLSSLKELCFTQRDDIDDMDDDEVETEGDELQLKDLGLEEIFNAYEQLERAMERRSPTTLNLIFISKERATFSLIQTC